MVKCFVVCTSLTLDVYWFFSILVPICKTLLDLFLYAFRPSFSEKGFLWLEFLLCFTKMPIQLQHFVFARCKMCSNFLPLLSSTTRDRYTVYFLHYTNLFIFTQLLYYFSGLLFISSFHRLFKNFIFLLEPLFLNSTVAQHFFWIT